MKTYTLTKNNSFIIEGRLFLSEHCTCNPELYAFGKRMVKPNVAREKSLNTLHCKSKF